VVSTGFAICSKVIKLAVITFLKKNEMGWACGAYGGEERFAQGFGGEA
jgi:hypothetical protein